jgi:ABC-type antimicrobial peptide transport system permease subunit
MLRNYFKTAWRSLLKNRLSAFINIGGLAVGMAVAMLIACWVYNEWSYNRQFPNYDRVAQVWQIWSGGKQAQSMLPAAVADELRAKFGSDFKRVVESSRTQEHVFAAGDKKMVQHGNFIEPAGLELFSVPMLRGDHSGLNNPNSVLLSASMAKALFGDGDPVGKVMSMDDTVALKVTGVYADFPYNSSFRDVSYLAPWDLYAAIDNETRYNGKSWGDNNWQTFVQLANHADIAQVSAKIKPLKAEHDPMMDDKGHNVNHTTLFLHPMNRWHLYSEFRDGDANTGRIKYVRLFGLIGALVLLLACINFMNLSTARSEKRAKEVGIRKVVGSVRGQLIGQFYCESLLVAFLALAIALGLVESGLPFFNQLAEANVSIPWSNLSWWLACFGFTLFTGLIAGSYPALYLSSFQPVRVLKGVWRAGRLASAPRKVLVVLQFTVGIAMIIGTIIVFRQVQYARSRPVGYDQGGLVQMHLHTTDIYQHFDAFRDAMLGTGAVAEVAQSVAPVTESWPFNGGLKWTGHTQWNGEEDFSMKGVTQGYAKTVGLRFIAGRDFRTGPVGFDAMTMVLNEAALKNMKLKDAIGKTVTWQGYNFTVIGIVKDVVMESPYENPFPAMYYLAPYTMSYVTIKLNPRVGAQEALGKIAPVVAKFSPAEPFDYHFVDEEYDAKFKDELRIGTLAGFFTALAILISCLGLFGLASFVAEQRIREIGVRKVLGATVFTLWKLQSREFVLLVGLSCLVAIPIAWSVLHGWLQQFQYRAALSGWIFAVAAAGALVITLGTVSWQAIAAARMNPVRSLRSDS